MKLSEFKSILGTLPNVEFRLPDGSLVPEHFHVTEVGEISKHFIDCGGTVRHEKKINFQLWSATDYNHRLHPEKLSKIIEIAEEKLGIGNQEIEVEYQGEQGIIKYAIAFNNGGFELVSTETACLAMESCGIPGAKAIAKLVGNTSCCAPNSGCC